MYVSHHYYRCKQQDLVDATVHRIMHDFKKPDNGGYLPRFKRHNKARQDTTLLEFKYPKDVNENPLEFLNDNIDDVIKFMDKKASSGNEDLPDSVLNSFKAKKRKEKKTSSEQKNEGMKALEAAPVPMIEQLEPEPPEVSKRSAEDWREYIQQQLELGKDIEDIMPKSLKPFANVKEEPISFGFS